MASFQIQIATEYPILFLSDASSNAKLPDALPDSLVTATADCLCFRVLSPVDGASIVTISDEDSDTGGQEVFNGMIVASTGVLTLMDRTQFRYMNIPVPIGRVPVSIWADGDGKPAWLWIKLEEIQTH